jgi:hypothetical protein
VSRRAAKRPKRLRFFEVPSVRTNEGYHPTHPTARPCGPVSYSPNAAPSRWHPCHTTLAAITPLSSPRTHLACARWCPAVHAALVIEVTDMSLLVLRSAPSPLRVLGRVLGVGSLRTLSRPDTSPGLIPGFSITSDLISFHFREPLRTPVNPAASLSYEAVL